MGSIGGYYQIRRNNTFVIMVAPNFRQVFPEIPVTQAQIDSLKIHPDGAYYSKTLAQRWHLKVGDHFPIKGSQPRADGSPVWIFQVLGIVDDLPAEFPAGFALGSLDYMEHARAVANQNKIGGFRVVVDNPQMGDSTAKLIDQTFANSGNPTWSMTEKFSATNGLAAAGINIDFLTRSVAGAGLFMILFLTANAIAQSVRERIPEFAVLKTIGFSDAGVMALVAAESAIPCLLGAGLGMSIAKWFAATLPKLLPPGIGLPLPYLSPFVFALAFGSAFLVAALSSVIPAMRLKRLDVATALSGRT
jgi:putative ABC transport system permease protein